MRQFIFLMALISVSSIANGQSFKATAQSNDSLNHISFLSGVRYAEILIAPSQESQLGKGTILESVFAGVIDYLHAMDFEEVGFSSDFINHRMPSVCEKAFVAIDYAISNKAIVDFTITFNSCQDEWWEFKSSYPILIDGWGNLENNVFHRLKQMHGFAKPKYDKNLREHLPIELTKWKESVIREHITVEQDDPLEGIYEGVVEDRIRGKYRIGIVKEGEEYIMSYIRGALNHEDWVEGEIKAELIETANPALFKLKWKTDDKSLNEIPYAVFELGTMNVVWPEGRSELFVKIFPTKSNGSASSGTGFALSSDGYIVTNQHVIDKADKIRVRGINGDFSKLYLAETVVEDRNNDLAIIRINDSGFTSLGQPPYSISPNLSDVGSSVYALGYPLRASMGDEVKLTNGIISSNTGFKGDITSYQVSVPVQPGNSGGPLINKEGEIIGIINSKHLDAENVSYAIKGSYLFNLIQNITPVPLIPKVNSISSKSLTEQVKLIKNYIYILEVD